LAFGNKGQERSLSARLADVGSLHGVWIDGLALAYLAAFRDGSSSDAVRENFKKFLMLADATIGPGVDGEESSIHIHEDREAFFLGQGELSQERGVAPEVGGGGRLGGEGATLVKSKHISGALAPVERKLVIAHHVHVHLGLADHCAEILGYGQVFLEVLIYTLRAADNDDVSPESGSPGVVLGGKSNRSLDRVPGSTSPSKVKFKTADTANKFPGGVHEFSLNGVEVGIPVDSRAAKSGQSKQVILQPLLLVSLLEGADEFEDILSLVFVAVVLLYNDNGVDALKGLCHLLRLSEAHVLSLH